MRGCPACYGGRAPVVIDRSYVYEPDFIDTASREDILAWLATLHPLWEKRYSTLRPPPAAPVPAAPPKPER